MRFTLPKVHGIRLACIMVLAAVWLPTIASADSLMTVTGTLPTTTTLGFGLTIDAASVVGSTNNVLATDVLTGVSGSFTEQIPILGSTVPNAVLIAGQETATGLLSCGFSTATGSLSGFSFLPFCSFFGGFTTQSDGSLLATYNIWEAATTTMNNPGNGDGTPVEIGSGTVRITQAPEPATLSLTVAGLLGLAGIVRRTRRKRIA